MLHSFVIVVNSRASGDLMYNHFFSNYRCRGGALLDARLTNVLNHKFVSV